MKLSDFHYDLPEDLIAQAPLPQRDGARMLVVDRKAGTWTDRTFRDLPEFAGPGDCFILNDSRVLPSRLLGNRPGTTGKIEVFLLQPMAGASNQWRCLVRPGRKLPIGTKVEFAPTFSGVITQHLERGERVIELKAGTSIEEALQQFGHVPLPPYIRREDTLPDRERYQTVFAKEHGSVAAPTAGLHFTPEILNQLRARGAEIAHVTLHVGLATFQPLPHDEVLANQLHHERFSIPETTVAAIQAAQRVIAVGTTATRTLETFATENRTNGETNLFLYPGYTFGCVGGLLTNFHLPSSSLMLLVSAFAGKELVMEAYRHAVKERYRFFSYGDCMLLL